MKKFFLLFSILVLLTSCDELTGASTGANNSSFFKVAGLRAIEIAPKKHLLEGTADNGGNSGHSFRLKFSLPEGESLKFFFYSSKSLNGGVFYEFEKTNGIVNLSISLNGYTDSRELDLNSDIIDLVAEIHNDHTDSHLFLWKNGEINDSEECTFEGTCLYNSEDFSFDTWLGVGRAGGTFWGFEGDKSLIHLLSGPLKALSDA